MLHTMILNMLKQVCHLQSLNGYIFFLGYKIPYAVAIGIIVGFVALVVFVVVFLLKRKKKKSNDAKRLRDDSADENQNDLGGDSDD